MNIVISDAARAWFKDEMGLQPGDQVRFYIQIYGSSPVQKGYALGFAVDNNPIDPAVRTEVDGIVFCVNAADVWYFDEHDLHIDYNRKTDEIEYTYVMP